MSLITRTHSKQSPNLRRGFFYALLSTLLCFSIGLYAAPTSPHSLAIQGVILDPQGHSIPYVSLIFQQSGEWILSDAYGHFSYSLQVNEKDSVLIQRIGYEHITLSSEDLLIHPTIHLIPAVINLNSIEVEGTPAGPTSMQRMGEFTKSIGMGTMDHNRVLTRIPGLSIKSYGGPAGISTLSLDGGPSSHTQVTLNGVDITSAQNGEADLSQLPLPIIQSMHYIPYDISSSGSGGVDGLVQLESGDQKSHINLSSGSYGHQAYDIYLEHNGGSLRGSLQFGQRHETGNYPVRWNQDSFFRDNNDLDQKFIAFKLRKIFSSELYWQTSFLRTDQSRGVAGLVWSPDTLSKRQDQLQLWGSTLGWLRPHSISHLHLSLRSSHESYDNPYLRLESDHRVQSFQAKMQNEATWNEKFALSSELSIHEDWIESSDASSHSRQTLIARVTPHFTLLKHLKLVPSFKYHVSPDLYQNFLQDYQAQINLDRGPLTQLAVSQGEIFKYPSFNDLYWEPGGNINLEAEATDVTTIQANLDLKKGGQLRLQWQKKASSNLIQWMPVHSYWQPSNIQSALRESSKAIWTRDFPKLKLRSHANYTLIYTQDIQRKEALRYAPSRTANVGLTWSPDVYELNLTYNYVSERISMYSYPENIVIEAASLWSFSMAHTWLSTIGSLTSVLSVDNLADIEYETIRGYPEPGRSLRFSLTYSL